LTLAARVQAMLVRGGRIAARWPDYEDRVGQRALAADVARTFEHGGVLLAEAPTGVGKSLAYLLPAVLAALEQERRVVVATCTKSLQDQLFERDLPAVLEGLGVTLPCARLKGKQNYVCPHGLATEDGSGDEERDALEELRAWAAAEEVGDLDGFAASDPETFRRLRSRVAADPHACAGPTCRRGRECFWVRARRQASEARLLVVNHALLALSGEADGLLPEFDLLVVDEAHRLEGVLLAQLERSVSRHRFEEALRLIGSGRRARSRDDAGEPGARAERGGLAARLRGYALPLLEGGAQRDLADRVERMVGSVPEARAEVERFFAAVAPRGDRHELYGARERYRSAAELLGSELEPLETLLGHCAGFARTLLALAGSIQAGNVQAGGGAAAARGVAEDLAAELERAAAVWGGLGADLEHLADASDRHWVYWRTAAASAAGEARRPARGVELHGSPVLAGEHARRLVLGRASAAVLTSATLSAGGEFGFTAERLGLGESARQPYEATTYPTPFPLERQMRTYVWAGDARDEAGVIAGVVAALAQATTGNQLVLFTAHERLKRARARLLERLPAERLLLAQEWDGPAARVSERFRGARGAVLLGVQSLWEGVDFPGAQLEILVVAKLPFSVPDDPLVQARGERLAERGLDPFRDDAVPEAVLRFRQGVGRLIRRADDRGVLVVCDPRLATASYRAPFLAALPVPPRPVEDAETLARDVAAFLAGSAERNLPMTTQDAVSPEGDAQPVGAAAQEDP
jgi:ATP-dependent DNA helicase DinG